MTLKAIDDLISNPPEFLRHNVICVFNFLKTGLYYPKKIQITKKNIKSNCVGSKKGKSGDFMFVEISQSPVPEERRRICWLHYEVNQNVALTLPANTGADVFMTDVLTACSFGFRPYSNGAISFAHANFLKNDGLSEEIDGRRNKAALVGYGALHKEQYITGKDAGDYSEAAIVYGFRNGTTWTIYVQKLVDYSGSSATISDVSRLHDPNKSSIWCGVM